MQLLPFSSKILQIFLGLHKLLQGCHVCRIPVFIFLSQALLLDSKKSV